ncbi:MAG: Cytidylyltransferase [Candidatus Paceibacter sp.]|jgi:glycerol-3-phosphate cytidylyltransferase|nr:Cytidylyltransferase [Candidatus Paceibacter sp.]
MSRCRISAAAFRLGTTVVISCNFNGKITSMKMLPIMKSINYMKYGFTCSAFDLCHAGHMLLFKEARENCDYLIVGLQDDPSADNHINMQYRGKLKNKPVMSLAERKHILESIKYIDEIFVYRNETDLYSNIQRLIQEGRFNVRFIGDDYKGKHYTGDDLPHSIYYIDRGSHGWSTSELRMRVYHAERERLEDKSHEKPIQQQGFGKRFAFQLRNFFSKSKDVTTQATQTATIA